MINKNKAISPMVGIILILVVFFIFVGVFSSIDSTNTIQVTDETPIDEFDGDYTKQEDLTRRQLGTISKVSSNGETEVGPLVGYNGNYEYNDVIYTVETISFAEN